MNSPGADATASDADEISHEPLSRLRRIIAQRMMESLQTSAQLTTIVEADVTRIAELRARCKDDFERQVGVKLSFLPFFAIAAIEALQKYRVINASLDSELRFVEHHQAQHLGVAVDTERGLMVPVIHHADRLSLAELAVRIDDVAARTRANQLLPEEATGATFTITNTGSRGALFDTPIVSPPQSAILGTGVVTKRVVPMPDESGVDAIVVRSMVYLALSYDHRIVDGADAARFLTHVKQRLEEGNFAESAYG